MGFPGGSAAKESACNAGDLGWEDPLEKVTATHSSILAWRIPWTVRSSPWGHKELDTTEQLSHGISTFETGISKVKSLSRVRLFVNTWTVAYQAPPSMGFSRQECWSGLPFPSPGDLPNPGIENWVSHIAGRRFTVCATREAFRFQSKALSILTI